MSKHELIQALCMLGYGQLMLSLMSLVGAVEATATSAMKVGYLFGSWLLVFSLLTYGLAYTIHKKGVRQ